MIYNNLVIHLNYQNNNKEIRSLCIIECIVQILLDVGLVWKECVEMVKSVRYMWRKRCAISVK